MTFVTHSSSSRIGRWKFWKSPYWFNVSLLEMLLFAFDMKSALLLWAPFHIFFKGAVTTIFTITLCLSIKTKYYRGSL